MRIVPRGHKREMVAQSFSDDMDGGLGSFDGGASSSFGTESVPEPDSGGDSAAVLSDPSTPEGDVASPASPEGVDDGEDDIQGYILEKLQGFGYPMRRLYDFEDEFVTEKIYAGGAREVTIILPDRYYGTTQGLKTSDFSEIVKEIQAKFGLRFEEGVRKDKKIEMSFSSEQQSDESGEEAPMTDVLDEIFTGRSERPEQEDKHRSLSRAAHVDSTKEMIHKSLMELMENLKKTGMEQK